MRFRTTLILLVLVTGLGAYIWKSETQSLSPRERNERAGRLLRWSPGDITSVAWQAEGENWRAERVDGEWLLREPIPGAVDPVRLDVILSRLRAARAEQYLSERELREEGVRLADLSLVRPRATLEVKTENGDVAVIKFGMRIPTGEGLYAQRRGEPGVGIVSETLVSTLRGGASFLLQKSLFPGEPREVQRVDLWRADGLLRMERVDSATWQVTTPGVATAGDPVPITHLIDELFALRISNTVAGAVADASAYGIDDRLPRVSVLTRDREQPEEWLIGNPVTTTGGAPLVYAKQPDSPTVVTAPARLRDLLDTDAGSVRDARLLPWPAHSVRTLAIQRGEERLRLAETNGEWRILEPVPAPADPEAVQELIGRFVGARLTDFLALTNGSSAVTAGLSTNWQARVAGGANGTRGGEARITALSPTGGGADDEIVRIDPGTSRSPVWGRLDGPLLPASLSPLRFRGRTVLALPPEQVKTISLLRHGQTQTVVRSSSGSWQAQRGADAAIAVKTNVIVALLETVQDLQADRVVDDEPSRLNAYIPREDRTAIEFGLREGAGIATALLFGREEEGEVFVTIRGREMVFALGTNVVEKMMRPLWEASAAEPDPSS